MALKRNSRSIIRIVDSVKYYLREIDIPLAATIVAISLFGLLNMYGLSDPGDLYFSRQLAYVLIGFGLMVLFSFLDYRFLKDYSLPVFTSYLFAVFLLILTFYSKTIRGVNSWIVLGSYTFEPAELVKLVLIIVMAKYFSQRHIHINQFRHIIISGVYFIVPLGIIIIQPDLGSAIILSFIWLCMLLAAGINKKHLAFLLVLGTLAGLLGWFFILESYQKDRVVSFINPYNDPRGTDYNLIQSQIAIGSGHILGKGFGEGSQSNLGLLPEKYNDFVFASIVEQFGLVGAGTIMLAFIFMISRILKIGTWAKSNFSKLFSIGLASFIFSHVFVSIGVNLGLMPVTGLPLSFLSFGGSHYISLMIGLGVLQSIKRHDR